MAREILFVNPSFNDRWESWTSEWEPSLYGNEYQLWETADPYAPLTPVFATLDELIDYLVETGDKLDGKWTRERAVAFVKEALG